MADPTSIVPFKSVHMKHSLTYKDVTINNIDLQY